MIESKNATVGANTDGGERTPRELSAMMDVKAVASTLGCSWRHVYRLADAGRMPRPAKLGALVRWSRATLTQWIADGCPNCRTGRKGAAR